jgi:hypothetical protein
LSYPVGCSVSTNKKINSPVSCEIYPFGTEISPYTKRISPHVDRISPDINKIQETRSRGKLLPNTSPAVPESTTSCF